MLALVWLLYSSFGITVGTLPPIVGPIIKDLGISYTQMGLILGSWQLVYIGTASPLGALVDRLGVRRSLGIAIILVWLSLVLRGFSIDFFTLLASVALFGIGGPIISIGAPKVVSLWFEGNERGTAAGIYTTGPVGGTALALATATTVIMPLTGSWRGVPFVFGAVVLVVAIAWWLLAQEVPSRVSEQATRTISSQQSTRSVLWEMLHIRNVQIMLLLAPATFMLNHGLGAWLPTLLQERGMTLSQAGSWTAAATGVSALGLLAIPQLARQGNRMLVIAILLIVSAGTTASLTLFVGAPLISVLLISTMARGPFMPILTLVLMETPGIGHRRIGAAAGIFFAAAEIGGFSGPFVMGLLRDATNSLNTGVFLLAGITAVLLLAVPLVQEQRGRTKSKTT